MNVARLLTRNEVLEEILREFESSRPDIDNAFIELRKNHRLPFSEDGFLFNNVASTVQEILVRQSLSTLGRETSEIFWDVIPEGESQRFNFTYQNGCLLVKKKRKYPHATKIILEPHTEIDFHGLVEGIPVVGEVKMGGYQTSGSEALYSGVINKKIRPVIDVFHRRVAYVAVIPKDQMRNDDKQEKFLERGGQLVAFPYDRPSWYRAVFDVATSSGIDFDPKTVPEVMRRKKSFSILDLKFIAPPNPGFA